MPNNSVGLKGSKLASIEVDYEFTATAATTVTATRNKVTRGADTVAATVTAQAHTATLTAATSKTVDQHKNTLTITTPFRIDQNEYVLVEVALEAGAGGNTADFLAAVANFTFHG